ncbi:MAG: hypothetical protein LBI61_02890 [Puniceicoccales bacterium]|jgi:hypothetical protein|nr:hypothetical protein [Puniceicoccales bacterium]
MISIHEKIVSQMVMFLCIAAYFSYTPIAGAAVKNPVIGDTYRVDVDAFIPLFSVPSTEFKYEVGVKGNLCRELDTILMPGFYVHVDEILKNGVVRVTVTNGSYAISGYVHRKFVEESMSPCESTDFSSPDKRAIPPSMNVISEKLNGIMEARYCYGCNSSEEIKLDGLYKFSQENLEGPRRSFKCCGFDSSGLVHYVSNGYLPHNTNELIELGVILLSIDTKKELSYDDLDLIMNKVADTDLVVFIFRGDERSLYRFGHVIMAWKFGFIESGGVNLGIVRTSRQEAKSRLAQMWREAKAAGSNLYVVKWHPSFFVETKVEKLDEQAIR